MPKKKKDETKKVTMDGCTFTVPVDEIPLETRLGVLITYHKGSFGVLMENERHVQRYDRKFHSTIGRARRWIEKQANAHGGFKRLDPETEKLTIALYDAEGYAARRDFSGTWRFGRLVRQQLDHWTPALFVLDGEKEVRPNYRTRGDDLYICDDPEIVDELNEAQAEVAEAIDRYKALRKKVLRQLPTYDSRPATVRLAKKQQARVRAKERREKARQAGLRRNRKRRPARAS